MMTGWLLAGTTFLASGVEAVEALTIVLAVGFARSWRPALSGAAWATIAILAIIAILGPAIIHYVPLAALKLGVGLFLMLFGLAWLRKAVLRYSGRKSLHDEEAIYRREYDALCAGGAAAPRGDRIGFLTAFNGVFLEGLEVAVIVVTFGAAGAHGFVWSALGAAAAA
ncbi:MAG: hypothetical protein KGM44_11315, partial [bacterium]|nr:hypothetical protein [bacterium]